MNLPPALVLFDIDGTLVRRAGPHHRQALVDAVRAVTGVETTTEGIPVQGMLDPDILSMMMMRGGMDPQPIRESMPAIIEKAQDLYIDVVPDLQDKACPGVPELLAALREQQILLGLVTGNLTRIGWRKLERANLRHYFRFGAFGEMAKDRSGLAKMAIETARNQRWIVPQTPISLIGDAPPDIIAAKENGIQSIAVYTGLSSADELSAYNPDVLVEDLRALSIARLTHISALPRA